MITPVVLGSTIELELDSVSFAEGDALAGTFLLNLTEPVFSSSLLSLTVANTTTKRLFRDVLDESIVDYVESSGTFAASNPEQSKTLVFPSAGEQFVYFSLPADASVNTLTFEIIGKPYNTQYPTSVRFDVGDDGAEEWRYQGTFSGFGSFVLPSELDESGESGSVSLTDDAALYCEIISLPDAKDFSISAKYDYGDQTTGNITAMLLSFTGSGSTLQAQGGADTCDLPEPTSGGSSYRSCAIRTSTFISGDRLICVQNKNKGTSKQSFYKLAKDQKKGVGYRCSALANGKTTCDQQIADFFIKVQLGEYTGALVEHVPFDDGKTQYLFEPSLTSFLDSCTPVDDFCAVPVRVSSTSPGNVFVSSLDIDFTSGGSRYSDNSFYDGSSTGSSFIEIDGVDLLSDAVELDFSLDVLHPVVPSVSNSSNYTLTLSLDALSDSVVVHIDERAFSSSDDFEDLLDGYRALFTKLAGSSSVDALGLGSALDDALDELELYRVEYLTLDSSNLSSAEYDDALADLRASLADLVESLPRSVQVEKRVTDTIVPSISDLTDKVVLPSQTNAESKSRLYEVQQSVTVTGTAEYVTITFLDNTTKQGTIITKTLSKTLPDAFVTEVIPSFVVFSADDLTFSVEPEIMQSLNPVIVRWPSSQASSLSYFVADDVVSSLQSMKTLVIPQQLREKTPASLATCGDGVCSFIEVDGEKIPLEDQYTCPADCPGKPLTPVIIGLIILALGVYYFYFYRGRYNFQALQHAPAATSFSKNTAAAKKMKDTSPSSPFISQHDEDSLFAYVRDTLNKGFPRDKIAEVLLKKNWTRDQVAYIFDRLKKR